MKKLLFILLALITTRLYADDTSAIQASITSGNYTMPANHAAYHISGQINLTHNLNGNGDTIYYTINTGIALNMNTSGKKVTNLVLIGASDTSNPSGSTGVYIGAASDTVMNCVIKKFRAYGILSGSFNTPEVYGNVISDIGYTGVFMSYSGSAITGGKIEYNTIDRSMLPASTVTEGGLMVRGDTINFSKGWLVQYNTIIMPYSPTDITAECYEHRNAPFSSIYNNTCRGGSIGISVVGSDYTDVRVNFTNGQSLEGIEFANSSRGFIYTNRISNQKRYGILIDGVTAHPCDQNVINSNTISGCNSYAIQLYHSVTNTSIVGDKITSATASVYLQQASGLHMVNVSFTGNSSGQHCIILDNSTGDISMLGGQVTSYGNVYHFYANTAVTTDKVQSKGVTLVSTGTGYSTALSGGAAVGSNIKVN